MPYPYELEQLARETGVSPLHVLEAFLERAAIREYDGGFSRDEAERLALADTRDVFTNYPRANDRAQANQRAVPGVAPSQRDSNTLGTRGTTPQGGGR